MIVEEGNVDIADLRLIMNVLPAPETAEKV
jgi:hypothetical protein